MASAAGIITAVGAISLVNEALNAPVLNDTSKGLKPGINGAGFIDAINWRIIPATAVSALMFTGLSKLNDQLATGLAYMALITVLFVPIGNAPAPLVHLGNILGYNGK